MHPAMLAVHEHRNPACTLCELHKSSTNVCIFGKGVASHELMIVGEAPGEAEAKTGMPFMGAAGKLLTSLMKPLNLHRHAYITNAVKCRPPENRPPKKEEIIRCRRYLFAEITQVKPRIVVCVGKIALLAVTGLDKAERGKPFASCAGHYGFTAFHVFHPAYCLRVMSAIKDLTDQLEAVADHYFNQRS